MIFNPKIHKSKSNIYMILLKINPTKIVIAMLIFQKNINKFKQKNDKNSISIKNNIKQYQ